MCPRSIQGLFYIYASIAAKTSNIARIYLVCLAAGSMKVPMMLDALFPMEENDEE